MATIMCLPGDVIELILGYNDISIDDIISFRFVWKEFHSTIKYVEPWERIFFHRWPSAKKVYDEQYKENEKKDSEENEQKDEINLQLDFIETGINCLKELRDYVSQIIHKHYYDNESIDNLILFEDVFHLDQHQHLKNNIDKIINEPENFIKYCFFVDEINYLLTQSSERTGCDLTERYCNLKLIYYMRQHSMIKKSSKFRYPEDLLDRMATIVAQAIKPEKDVFYSRVKASLDNIALEILNCLKEKHPHHSIFSTSAETFFYWKNNNIDENHWSEIEGTQIIDTLEEYIFGKLNFRPCRLHDRNDKNICIDNVLKNKRGQEIILLIIYHSVARRLGLRCDIIGQVTRKGRRLINIFWKPKHATKGLENVRCLSIISKKFPDCLVNQARLLRQLYADSKEVLEIRAAEMWYVIKSLFIVPEVPDAPLQIIPNNSRNTSNFYIKSTEQFNTRPEDVIFAVGMIVRCQITNCTGVIVGWHRSGYKHTWFIDSFWKHNINTQIYFRHCNFYATRQQTHYIIFIEGNELCYVGEDRITVTTPKWIDNSEIGRYFCKFEGTHYVPNQMLAKHYPHDAAIIAKWIGKN